MIQLAYFITGLTAVMADEAPVAIDLNSILGGSAGATLVGLIFYVGKLILDRTIPSRSDARANITVLLEGLQSMVKVMQAEKDADAKRLADRQARIDILEEASGADYARKAELQAEVIDLRVTVARKERHIKELVHMLTSLGAKVDGLDSDNLEITLPASEVAEQRKKHSGKGDDPVD